MREFVLKDLFPDPIPAKDEEDHLCCENEDLKTWNSYKDNFIDDNDDEEVQAKLVVRGLFICEFAYSRMKYWSKCQISSRNVFFYLQIQYARSKIARCI